MFEEYDRSDSYRRDFLNINSAPPGLVGVEDMIFVAFNSQVMAMDRDSGEVIWKWTPQHGRSSHVAIHLNDDRLIVSIQGYTYAIDAATGEQLWANLLKGTGYGIPTIASAHGNNCSADAANWVAQHNNC